MYSGGSHSAAPEQAAATPEHSRLSVDTVDLPRDSADKLFPPENYGPGLVECLAQEHSVAD